MKSQIEHLYWSVTFVVLASRLNSPVGIGFPRLATLGPPSYSWKVPLLHLLHFQVAGVLPTTVQLSAVDGVLQRGWKDLLPDQAIQVLDASASNDPCVDRR